VRSSGSGRGGEPGGPAERGGFPAELLSTARAGGMNRLMAAHDWSAGPLGSPGQWPAALRTAVGMCMNSGFPMMVWWGPELLGFYNDAFVPILGAKHPDALGRPGSRVWADVWPAIGGMVEGVVDGGEAVYHEDLPLIMGRHGFDEEAFFTFSYSPILGPDGAVGGVLITVTETTTQVLGTRRVAVLERLGAIPAAHLGDLDRVATAAVDVLAGHRGDLPFGLVYLAEDDGARARLLAGHGVDATRALDTLPKPDDELARSVWHTLSTGEITTCTELTSRSPGLADRLASPLGAAEATADTALVLPLCTAGQGRPIGALVLGVSPFLRLDDGYRQFLELVAGQVTSRLTDARAYEAQRRRAEELARLDRAKTEFFTGVSHELRTPLALITGPTEDSLTDRENPLPPVHRDRLEIVRRNGGRLRRLVDTLLDFARIEGSRLTPELTAVDAGDLTRGLAESFAPAVVRAGLEMVINCPDLVRPLMIDPQMWEKITLNLLSNAVKFTLSGTVRISVSLRPASLSQDGPDAAEVVELQVADTGVGIPTAEVPLLFQRFHRVAGVTGRSHEGSGIGLALVAEMVGVHGGTVAVTSRPGAGSTFTVRIPARDAGVAADVPRPLSVGRYLEEALQWSAPDLPVAPGADLGRAHGSGDTGTVLSRRAATVLVVEDNNDMRRYLAQLLAPHYRVLTSRDGEAALRKIHSSRPDLVLSDVMMPRLDGFGLLAALRADPTTATVPVIMLSARAGEGAAIEGLTAGVDDYLVKPFSSAELLARVGATLELARARAGESRRLGELARASIAINGARTTPQVIEVLALSARELTGARHAAVTLSTGPGRPAPVSAESVSDRDTALSGSDPPGQRLLTIPLTAADGANLGLVRVSDRRGGEFTRDDEAILTQLAEIGSAVLDKVRLLQEQTEVALTLQRSILGPTQLPSEFAVRYEPAPGTLEVGGDWYDVVSLAGGRYGVVVGDVVGRGLAAASVMGQLRSATRALLLENHTPAQVLTALDAFAALIPDALCSTVFCAVIDPAAHSVAYSSAGHPPAILAATDGTHQLLVEARSVRLAVLELATRPESRTELPPGSTLLLYTDGLVERRRESIDIGIGRAASILGRGPDESPEQLARQLGTQLLGDNHDDDVAFLLYRHPGRGYRPAARAAPGSELHHRHGPQRRFPQPAAERLHQHRPEPVGRVLPGQLPVLGAGHTGGADQTGRDVGQVGTAERLDKGVVVARPAQPVVLADQAGHELRVPRVRSVQLGRGALHRRGQVVPGPVEPDAGVVEEAGHAEGARDVGRDVALQPDHTDHPVHVAPVDRQVRPEDRGVAFEELVRGVVGAGDRCGGHGAPEGEVASSAPIMVPVGAAHQWRARLLSTNVRQTVRARRSPRVALLGQGYLDRLPVGDLRTGIVHGRLERVQYRAEQVRAGPGVGHGQRRGEHQVAVEGVDHHGVPVPAQQGLDRVRLFVEKEAVQPDRDPDTPGLRARHPVPRLGPPSVDLERRPDRLRRHLPAAGLLCLH
jgi:signal transduction histidine kinase/DNA-binding response OmpR family regulator